MPTHHHAPGSARRRALAALVAPLTIAATLLVAGPASADTKTFADGVGEDGVASPTGDITQYQVILNPANITVTITTAATADAPLPSDAQAEVDVDLHGDNIFDFYAWDDGTGTWTVYRVNDPNTPNDDTEMCSGLPVSITVNTLSFTGPISCFGSPTQVTVAVGVWLSTGFDVAPDQHMRAFSPAVDNGPDVAPTTAAQQVVYRFWSPKFNNAHFFTTSDTEAWHIYQTDTNWTYEGKAFSALAASGETCTTGAPVFRFYSPVFQSHFYTQNADEKAHIIAADRNWNYEGVAYCAYSTQQAGTTAVYRFWSPGFGKHFFTASQAEADHIKAVDRNWNYEGIAYYVQP